MAKIALISCVSKKLPHKAKARDLYISLLFQKSLKYTESLGPNKIFVLSAKYRLLRLNREIYPYNITLNKMSVKERKEWASAVICELKEETNLEEDNFIILAGIKYRQYLLPYIKNYEIPLEGLKIGEQLHQLNERILNE